jgi:hypothetical protein
MLRHASRPESGSPDRAEFWVRWHGHPGISVADAPGEFASRAADLPVSPLAMGLPSRLIGGDSDHFPCNSRNGSTPYYVTSSAPLPRTCTAALIFGLYSQPRIRSPQRLTWPVPQWERVTNEKVKRTAFLGEFKKGC